MAHRWKSHSSCTRASVIGAAFAVCAAAFAFSAGDAVAAEGRLAGQEIRIGAIVPATGPFAEWGKSQSITLKMLESEVNAAGGVEGAKLSIVIYDDGAKPAQAANLVRKLSSDDKVLAIVGPHTSSCAEVAFPVANQEKIVITSHASSKPGVAAANRPWSFRNSIDEGTLAETTVPYFKKAFNIGTAAIIYDAKDANSTSIANNIMPATMAKHGITVANAKTPVSFNTGDIDVSAQITSIKAMKPDGIVIGAEFSQAVTVIREMKRQGLNVPIIGGTPLLSSSILQAAPDLPVIAPATYFPGSSGEMALKFTARLTPMLRASGSGMAPTTEPNMYDATITEVVNMYIEAVKQKGVTGKPADLAKDREKVLDYMTNVSAFGGFNGPMAFKETGDARKAFFVLMGKNGKWSEEVRGCSGEHC